ncbi:DNA cytosine methyltransferase [Paenibacillus glucanolyticus]|uniref:DNA cytosine methyltransferase n=1 Tax=Paenibacillus glucanolyticus TaxID=59843 RepID=UPI0034CDDB80
MIRTRRAKNSSRGIYLQDRQLSHTVFQPGTHFRYVIDRDNRKIIILPSESPGNTVSKREMKHSVKPVLDIRSKQVLDAFKDCAYLQVDIYEEEIVVRGFVADADEAPAIHHASDPIETIGKIRGIQDFLRVKQTAEIVISRDEFQNVTDRYGSSLVVDIPYKSIRQALQHLYIPLQIDSLFSGAGLMDFAFAQAGFDIAFAIEKDADAVRTYRHNLGDHIHHGDITQIDRAYFTSPVMIGGSPCQGFSNSNRNTNYLDNPNNRLVREYIDAVKSNQNCKVFVLENVPQLLSAGDGQFKDEILGELKEFEIQYGVLNAADFGSPQPRKRAIFIGSKIGKIRLPKAKSNQRAKNVRFAFSNLDPDVPNQADISKVNAETLGRIRSVPEGGNISHIPDEIRPKGTHSNQYRRLEWDEPAVTVVMPRKAMLLHPEADRILSVRECARLQGLPDEFAFQGGLTAKQQQVANGVPIQLTKAIAHVIRKAINAFNSSFTSKLRIASV